MIFEITIPVLNEEPSLESQIKKILKFLDSLDKKGFTFHLVIADNGSTDNTGQIGERLAQALSNVKYIRLPKPGVGAALKTSWAASNADIIGYMDLDLSTDINHLREVVDIFKSNDFDIVNGSRLLSGSQVVGRKPLREIASRVFNFLLSIFFNITFTDGMCGFKFLRSEVIEPIRNGGANNDGWFFSTEILIIGEKLGYRIKEIPVKWTDDPDSRVKVGKLTFRYLKDMFRLRHSLGD